MDQTSPEKPKVVFVTAGGAGMYCGSCMRDNTLVRNLMQQGWDIELLPAYTPVRTDEEDVSVDHVVFGGINMYLQQKIPFLRWLPRWMDRWLDNPKLIKSLSSGSIDIDAKQLGRMTLATVQGESGILRKEHRKFVDWLRDHSHPELINLTNLLIGGCIPLIRKELPGKTDSRNPTRRRSLPQSTDRALAHQSDRANARTGPAGRWVCDLQSLLCRFYEPAAAGGAREIPNRPTRH